MSLVRTSILNSVAVIVRLVSALALNKILAVLIGPTGFALIGQFQSIISLVVGVTGSALSNGVIKGTAEHFEDEIRQRKVWSSAIRLSLWATLAVAVLLVLFKGPLTSWLFQRDDLSNVFVWLVLALPAISANTILLAILNGRKQIAAYVASNVAGSLIALTTTATFASVLGIHGALISMAISPAISLVATAAFISRMKWFHRAHLWGPVAPEAVGELSKFALMTLTTALCAPIAQVLIRDHLAQAYGWAYAGYWQAVCKISEIYLMFIMMTLATYYLPRIAEIRHAAELRSEIAKVYRFALPIATAIAVAIYLMRDGLVIWLFTADFGPMKELFGWQLAGDVVKVASWVLGYILIGRAAAKPFVLSEVAFSGSLVLLTWALTGLIGFKGVALAHFVNYVLYLLVMALVVTRLMRSSMLSA